LTWYGPYGRTEPGALTFADLRGARVVHRDATDLLLAPTQPCHAVRVHCCFSDPSRGLVVSARSCKKFAVSCKKMRPRLGRQAITSMKAPSPAMLSELGMDPEPRTALAQPVSSGEHVSESSLLGEALVGPRRAVVFDVAPACPVGRKGEPELRRTMSAPTLRHRSARQSGRTCLAVCMLEFSRLSARGTDRGSNRHHPNSARNPPHGPISAPAHRGNFGQHV